MDIERTTGHGDRTDRLRQLLSAGPVRWLLAGDSITAGWGLRNADDGYAGRFVAHLAGHAGPVRAADVVANSGVPGATARDTLWDFDARILAYDAQVVSILLGMNDAGAGLGGLDPFARDLAKLIDQVEALGALPILQTPYPVGAGDGGSHVALPAYCDAIRELAAHRGVPLVDHAEHWAGLDPARIAGWYLDPWHLREPGHAELASFLIAALLSRQEAGGCR